MKKYKGSLFFRLLIIFGATFLIMAISLFMINKKHKPFKFFKTNMKIYSEYLMKDIGTPPDPQKVKALHERTKIHILIHGPQVEISTHDKLKALDINESSHRYWRHRRAFRYKNGEYTYIFAADNFSEASILDHIISLGVILFILILSYHIVKRSFYPLREIEKVTGEIAEGDFSARVKCGGSGELKTLSDSVNVMAGKIEKQFHQMRELLMAVSHELRSPLTRIRMSAEFIDKKKLRNSIVEEVQLLDDLTFKLLESEKVHQGLQKSEVSVLELLKTLKTSFGDKSSLIQIKLENDIMYSLDSNRALLCLRNIVDNAFKYVGDSPIELKAEKIRDQLKITVEDQGGGIPQSVIDNLGQAFLSADSARTPGKSGFGLGLKLCHNIALAHGGELKIQSNSTGTQVILVI